MPTYISLLNWTQQGEKNIRETGKREAAFAKSAQKLGAKVIAAYWTMGRHDGVLLFEAPDDETATATALALGALGNVATETMRAFTADDMAKIVAKLP
ncbi:GYD family protein [Planctomycetaceae bacterium SCGC AG-212-F19]|nr:GYD family protein [Planctomycetaceae bacterium SCGC AG-212-F19]